MPLSITVDPAIESTIVDQVSASAYAYAAALGRWVGRDGHTPPTVRLHLVAKGMNVQAVATTAADGAIEIDLECSGPVHFLETTLAHEFCHAAQFVLDPVPDDATAHLASEFLAERSMAALARSAGLDVVADAGLSPEVWASNTAILHRRVIRHLRAASRRPDGDIGISNLACDILVLLRFAAYAAGAGDAAGVPVSVPFAQRKRALAAVYRAHLVESMTPLWSAAQGLSLLPSAAEFRLFAARLAADPRAVSSEESGLAALAVTRYVVDGLRGSGGRTAASDRLVSEMGDWLSKADDARDAIARAA